MIIYKLTGLTVSLDCKNSTEIKTIEYGSNEGIIDEDLIEIIKSSYDIYGHIVGNQTDAISLKNLIENEKLKSYKPVLVTGSEILSGKKVTLFTGGKVS